MALSLGVIYNVLGRFEQARDAFDHVLRAPMRLALQPHRSFAALGQARALVGLTVAGTLRVPSASLTVPSAPADRTDDSPGLAAAKAAYLVSLDATPDAAWNEHTLRELALLIEELAARQAETLTAARAEAKSDSKAKPREVASADTRAMLRATRAEALPYWEKLIARFPASTYLPEALYHAGILYAEAVKPAAEKSVASFERLVNEFPASPWTGDAHVRLIDVKLEQQFDLPAAATHAQAATQWLDNAGGANAAAAFAFNEATPGPEPLPSASAAAWSVCPTEADGTTERACHSGSLDQTRYAIYLRAGLVAYLSERLEEAVESFERAKPFEPERSFVVVHGEIPTGIERLIAAARTGKSFTPEEARRGDEKARLILMLADVYHEGEQWQQSLDLCTRVIADAAPKAAHGQKSYAHFRRARNHYSLDGKDCNPEAALADYVATVHTAPKAPWASKAMFLAANIQWNHKHDGNSAITIWKRLVHEYPASEQADASTLFISVVYRWTNRPDEARKVLMEFLEKRPDSPLAEGARKQLTKLDSLPSAAADPAHRQKGPGQSRRQHENHPKERN